VLECLGKVPDHCAVVAWPYPHIDRLKDQGFDVPSNLRCATRCLPQRCGCADEACASHSERNYGQGGGVSDDGVPDYEGEGDYQGAAAGVWVPLMWEYTEAGTIARIPTRLLRDRGVADGG